MINEAQQKAINTALRAGEEILKVYKTDFGVFEKEDDSPVTQADLNANEVICKELCSLGWPILSEESKDEKERMSSERVWVVDPLDGTADFVQHTDEFCIMIGLIEDGKPLVGVVYLPAQDKLYYAARGEGAFMKVGNDEPVRLRVSEQDSIADARLVVSKNHFSEDMRTVARALGIEQFMKVGSNGIKLGLIAEGKADLFYNPTPKLGEWDTCAPELILTEAGGKVTGIGGEELLYNKEIPKQPHGIIGSNGLVHHDAVGVFEKLSQD